jgi:predicted nuclease of predicted toxin-antitoxin system
MRFLADENFPGAAIRRLRQDGHDVSSLAETSPGASDYAVLEQAVDEGRILLTFDKDFGELCKSSARTAPFGVVLFRISLAQPSEASNWIARQLESRHDWSGALSVVEADRIRMRRFEL